METSRVCIKCGIRKQPDQFYAGQGNTCKACIKLNNKAWRKANPVRYRATRRAWEKGNVDLARKRKKTRIKRRYKLTHEQFMAMMVAQDNKCAICKVPLYDPFEYAGQAEPEGFTKPVIDHDHRDGHVRGLLCSACNVAIGLLEDSLKVIKAAFYYLKNDQANSALR